MWSEPAGALTDLAMAQWEEASVITVRGNVAAEGTYYKLFHPSASPATPPVIYCPSLERGNRIQRRDCMRSRMC